MKTTSISRTKPKKLKPDSGCLLHQPAIKWIRLNAHESDLILHFLVTDQYERMHLPQNILKPVTFPNFH